ncbi:pyridoxamine 5'-phosphate oxidase family protein [Aurantiacibacter gilvus]|uniref:Pyridoxamine 5'-phosphate oxidase family protein n=1 Tax=Aurantiacibacter gilvus TaxID=3139141 RepID=A0ABU9IFB7_9SPHN
MSTPDELKNRFWTALADSPYLFLQLDSAPEKAVPMTAQLDKDADSAIWFFTSRDHGLARMGPATATFAGKDHDMFARFSGRLTEETSRERLEQHWSPMIEAWFDGKDDPRLLMLRMDLGQAEIWNSDMGFFDNAKMLLGFDSREEAKEEHAEVVL